jgi:hypothetical protein
MKLILSFFLLMRLIFVSGRDEIVVEKLLAALKIRLEEITSPQTPEAVVYGLKKTGVAQVSILWLSFFSSFFVFYTSLLL